MLGDAHGDPRRRRARALAACAALAVALHLAFLDGFGGWAGRAPDLAPTPLSVRTIVIETASPAVTEATPSVAPLPSPARPQPRARPPKAKDEHTETPQVSAGSADHVGTDSSDLAAAPAERASDAAVVPAIADAASAALQSAPSSDSGSAWLSTIPGAGDRPPPVYPTRLPPPATLHYQVRRGALRGDGEIRWQPAGDSYRLVLEARIAGLTLLVQTSEGAIDGDGVAPVRFLDQRARRAAQAANFVRDGGRITFSATTAEWPLVAGAQDRLSWMIQLAGIVAADPALLSEGGRITMAVVGARGDAAIWSLRCVGEETVETARGVVAAVKLVREARAATDTTAEIWLDPARSYLPAHATLRNASGASEYDLLLDRVDP